MPAPLGWARARQAGRASVRSRGAGADMSHEVLLGDGPGHVVRALPAAAKPAHAVW
jgi:hypothetical protein